MVGLMRRPKFEPKMNFLYVSRRHFFRQGLGLSAVGLSTLLASDSPVAQGQNAGSLSRSHAPHFSPRAKSVIHLHMVGAPSQLDMLDPKPDLSERHGENCPEALLDGLKLAFIGDRKVKTIKQAQKRIKEGHLKNYAELEYGFYKLLLKSENNKPIGTNGLIKRDTLELPDDLFDRYFLKYKDHITFLSGPSFAKEIVDKQVTIVSLAGRVPSVLMNVSEMLGTNYFR